jgi:hypothetical protein
MSDSITPSSVALDCPDAGTLAEFYADITGGTVVFRNEAWATVVCPGRADRLPDRTRVHAADLAGHPFCLSTWDDTPS